jgi:hypothetical protein
VTDYLVEVYLQRTAADELPQIVRRARAAAEAITAAGTSVDYLGAIAIVEDEMCFHLYAGPSAVAVSEAARRAAIPVDRIVEAVHLNGDGTGPPG